jgi:3-dehydroquinate synthase
VKTSLEAAGYEVTTLEVASGEESKSLKQAAELCRELIRTGLDRGSAVIGLGGGVIGDLAGFVSGILYRGIRFINIPTTLLSQVDSSVGGKTGVNVAEGKNLVGVFHQPSLVLADIGTLRSLPEREFRSGLGEVVKYGMISDRRLFELLEQSAERVSERDSDLLQRIVSTSCAIKARVVAADERETGLRAILNFGHTVGHAVEAALGYGAVTHGEAVAMGMVVAAELSVAEGLCPREDAKRLKTLLQRFGLLNTPLPEYESLEPFMLRDKKARSGSLQFVAVRGAGAAELIVLREFERLRRAVNEARHSLC